MSHKKKNKNKKLNKMHQLPEKKVQEEYMTSRERHAEMSKMLVEAVSIEYDERDDVREDLEFAFVEGQQWDNYSTQRRINRPRYTINKVAVALNQVCGEQRMNRSNIKIRPASSEHKAMANVLNGLVRSIQASSNFDSIKDVAFKEMSAGGIGAWQMCIDYASPDSFDREVILKPIHSAFSSVHYDPSALLPSKEDAMWMSVMEEIPTATFKKLYPGKSASSVTSAVENQRRSCWYARPETIKVADFWVKEPIEKYLALLSDGSTMEYEKDQNPAEMVLPDVTVIETKKRQTYRVVHYRISGHEILEGPHEFPGEFIPIIPVFGFSTYIENKHYYRGLVRPAKDPQRLLNYNISTAVEVSALSPKATTFITPKQIKGFEPEYKKHNVRNTSFLRYNPDDKAPGPPQRSAAPSVGQALLNQIAQSDADIQATIGIFSQQLGESQFDQSGRAITALNRQASSTMYELNDNLAKAIQHTGKIILGLVSTVYDTPRIIKIVGEDESMETVAINQMAIDEKGEQFAIKKLKLGDFQVSASVGPSYASKRAETLNILSRMAQENPQFGQIAGDLIAKSIDFEHSDELSRRQRKMGIAQGYIEMNDEEMAEAQANAPQPSATDKINFESMKLDLERKAAEVDMVALSNEKILADTVHKKSQTHEVLWSAEKAKAEAQALLLGIPNANPAIQQNIESLETTIETDEQYSPDLIINKPTNPEEEI